MDEDIIARADAYSAGRNLRVVGRLGFGIHGTVFAVEDNVNHGESALKIHNSDEPYRRERDVYRRLAQHAVCWFCEFQVPKMIDFDDELQAVELSIVIPPFVLDFAGAYLDFPPLFSAEIWEEWEAKNRDEFGDRWPKVQQVIGEMEDYGIFMYDPSPSNIRFE